MPGQLTPPASTARPSPRQAHLQNATDDALLSWVRQGNSGALTELYARHYPDSLRYAKRLIRRHSHHDTADDVASEAMRKVLSALSRGHGPTIGFRQYLFTAVRTVTCTARMTTDTAEADDQPVMSTPAADEHVDAIVAMQAFESLPYRWRQVLWMTKVDQLTASEVGPLIGLSANSVAALATRAREALRIAFIRAHLPQPEAHQCRLALDLVARRALGPISSTKLKFLNGHLDGCDDCRVAEAGVGDDVGDWSRLVELEAFGEVTDRGDDARELVTAGAA